MAHRETSIKLSRRLLSTYLLFGLLSIVAVTVGMAFLLTSVSGKSDEQTLLTKLVRVAAEVTQLSESQQDADVQSVVADLANDSSLLFCAVIGEDGIIKAHTSPGFVGHTSPANFSAAQAPGVVERVSYLHEDGTGPREYWLPLRNERAAFGMLQVALTTQRPDQGLVSLIRHNAGLAMGFPVVLLVIGGARLRRVVSASTLIGQQLANLTENGNGTLDSLRPIEEQGPESIGWNRLVSRSTKAEVFSSLESRLTDALGGFREKRYEQILQALTDGVAVTSETGRVTFANEAFARLLNCSHDELVGASLADVLPKDYAENITRFEKQMAQQSRPGVIELSCSADMADGVFRLGRTPLRSHDGQINSQLWSLRDVTQQKLGEYTRDQFVATATHELRTPLSTIKACAEALELFDDIDLETQKHYVNTINNESTRLGRFVDEFLNISRMEAGSLALNRHSTQLERLLKEVIEKARPGIELKQLEFSSLMPPKLPELNIDKDKIAAALINLLGNAEKYTPAGGQVKLMVELTDGAVRVHVEDSGMGISAEELPRVFNKFFRSDDERVRQITGTGLGLSFAQEVIRLHGGNLTVTSEKDHGARFTMTLPMQEGSGRV